MTCHPEFYRKMAERQGFEPWVLLPAHRFSKPTRSTTPASLHDNLMILRFDDLINFKLQITNFQITIITKNSFIVYFD